MPTYEIQRAIQWKDGTSWPRGASIAVEWGEYPASSNVVTLGADKRAITGKGLGRALAGELPSVQELNEWTMDSVCDTPTGHSVEPDGFGPDGCPAWLLLLGFL